MFDCDVKLTENMQWELNKKNFICMVILTVIGAIGSSLYIVLETVYEFLGKDVKWVNYLIFFAALLGLGIVGLVSIYKTNKSVTKVSLVNHYLFNEDHFILTTSRDGENIGTLKIKYNEIQRVRETENFLFLYKNRSVAFPILKSSLSTEYKNLLLGMIKVCKVNNSNTQK